MQRNVQKVLRTTYYVLRTTYYVLRTTYYVLRTTYYVLRATKPSQTQTHTQDPFWNKPPFDSKGILKVRSIDV